jgi:hypothetical protein
MDLQLIPHFRDAAYLGNGLSQGVDLISQHLPGQGDSRSSDHDCDGSRVTDHPSYGGTYSLVQHFFPGLVGPEPSTNGRGSTPGSIPGISGSSGKPVPQFVPGVHAFVPQQ